MYKKGAEHVVVDCLSRFGALQLQGLDPEVTLVRGPVQLLLDYMWGGVTLYCMARI